MNGANRHLGDLGDGSVSDLSDIARQILIGSLEGLLPEPRQPHTATVGVHIPHVPHNLLPLLHFLRKTQQNDIPSYQNDIALHSQGKKKLTRTSRSSWMGVSMSLERELRVPDQRSETVPVNMDQNARSKMAANAQNLYLPFPNRLESKFSFFVTAVVVGSPSSSFISI